VTARCRRSHLVVVLAVAATLTVAGCQGGADTSRSAAAPRTTNPSTITTTTSTTAPAPTTPAPTTPAGPTPTGPLGNPWPQIGAAPPGHHTILAMGDSLMGLTVVTLPDVLAAHGFDAVVYDAHVSASGLLDPMNGSSARDYFALQLAAHPDVDTVMFEWTGVCAVGCGPDTIPYGSPAFFAAWHAAAADLVHDAYAHGLAVLWAISPPPPPDLTGGTPIEDWSSTPMRFLVGNALSMSERRYPADFGVTVADWWQALSDTNGQWQQALWYDNALHVVRVDDRLHFTSEGSTRSSTWTVAALARLYQR